MANTVHFIMLDTNGDKKLSTQEMDQARVTQNPLLSHFLFAGKEEQMFSLLKQVVDSDEVTLDAFRLNWPNIWMLYWSNIEELENVAKSWDECKCIGIGIVEISNPNEMETCDDLVAEMESEWTREDYEYKEFKGSSHSLTINSDDVEACYEDKKSAKTVFNWRCKGIVDSDFEGMRVLDPGKVDEYVAGDYTFNNPDHYNYDSNPNRYNYGSYNMEGDWVLKMHSTLSGEWSKMVDLYSDVSSKLQRTFRLVVPRRGVTRSSLKSWFDDGHVSDNFPNPGWEQCVNAVAESFSSSPPASAVDHCRDAMLDRSEPGLGFPLEADTVPVTMTLGEYSCVPRGPRYGVSGAQVLKLPGPCPDGAVKKVLSVDQYGYTKWVPFCQKIEVMYDIGMDERNGKCVNHGSQESDWKNWHRVDLTGCATPHGGNGRVSRMFCRRMGCLTIAKIWCSGS